MDLQGSRDGSNNLAITWTRRTRAFGGELTDGGTVLLDGVENYTLEMLDGPAGAVVTTIEDVLTNSYTYTAAAQTSDGYTPGNPIDVKVYQTSPLYGRGKGEEQEL